MKSIKTDPRKRELFQEMISIYQPKNMKEFSEMFKDMFAESMQQAMEIWLIKESALNAHFHQTLLPVWLQL